MAKFVIEMDEQLKASYTGLVFERGGSSAAIANAIPLADYLASIQPTPPANAVTVPLKTWIGPEGVTVAGFAPLGSFSQDAVPVDEILIQSCYVDSEMIEDNITASIAIPLLEPVTVVGKVEVKS